VADGVANCAFAEPADERPKRGDLLVAVDGAEMRPAAAEIEAIQAQQFPELARARHYVSTRMARRWTPHTT
jgi:hypothetical protein